MKFYLQKSPRCLARLRLDKLNQAQPPWRLASTPLALNSLGHCPRFIAIATLAEAYFPMVNSQA